MLFPLLQGLQKEVCRSCSFKIDKVSIIVLLSVVMLSVIMLSAIMLSIIESIVDLLIDASVTGRLSLNYKQILEFCEASSH
jgi:hypothetical protein